MFGTKAIRDSRSHRSPTQLFAPLRGNQPRTEVLINLDAGGIRRAIDGVTKQQGFDLRTVSLPALDCLFGDRSWRELPPTVTQTGDRQRWLIDHYAARVRGPNRVVETWPLEGGADFRTLIQFAAHDTAIATFRKHYDQTTKLWKKPKPGPSLDELAAKLKAEFPDQTLTPRSIYWLGVLPEDIAPGRINQACDLAMHLGIAQRSKSGVQADVTFTSTGGLFD